MNCLTTITSFRQRKHVNKIKELINITFQRTQQIQYNQFNSSPNDVIPLILNCENTLTLNYGITLTLNCIDKLMMDNDEIFR